MDGVRFAPHVMIVGLEAGSLQAGTGAVEVCRNDICAVRVRTDRDAAPAEIVVEREHVGRRVRHLCGSSS